MYRYLLLIFIPIIYFDIQYKRSKERCTLTSCTVLDKALSKSVGELVFEDNYVRKWTIDSGK